MFSTVLHVRVRNFLSQAIIPDLMAVVNFFRASSCNAIPPKFIQGCGSPNSCMYQRNPVCYTLCWFLNGYDRRHIEVVNNSLCWKVENHFSICLVSLPCFDNYLATLLVWQQRHRSTTVREEFSIYLGGATICSLARVAASLEASIFPERKSFPASWLEPATKPLAIIIRPTHSYPRYLEATKDLI